MREYQLAPANVERRVARLRTLARLLDNIVRIPFTHFRIGLDALLGLIPGFGDVAGAVAAAYIIVEAGRLGAPRKVLLRMVYNVALEALVGLVPALGDVFDAGWRANLRNVALLEGHLQRAGTAAPVDRRSLIGVVGALSLLMIGVLALTFVTVRALVRVMAG